MDMPHWGQCRREPLLHRVPLGSSLWSGDTRLPDGIMAAYPATMLQSTTSPSHLLSLMDPLLPLSVLSKCVSASAGRETEDYSDSDQKALGMMGLVRRDTALLLRDLRLNASSWLNSFLELSRHRSHMNSVPMASE
ncbi:hormone-sensitive lipase-like [Equus asinus]|uniref:hormone-sensitive lipase-like n=1 Tax=Equus asinus TaxID=9793 RepID=UPI0038F67791